MLWEHNFIGTTLSVVAFDLSTDTFRVAVVPSDKIIYTEVKNYREELCGTPVGSLS